MVEFAVSADEKWVYYNQYDSRGFDIMLDDRERVGRDIALRVTDEFHEL